MKLKSYTNKDRYGNMTSFEFYEGASVDMGDVPPMMQGVPDHPGDPKGTDTVPAWLTPGEFVMNAEATRMFEPQIEQMNNAGRAKQAEQGGTIPEYAAHGKPIYAAAGGNSGFLANILKRLEGVKSEAYLDSAGKATIGAGSTRGVQMGDTASDDQVDSMLSEDIAVVDQDYGQLVSADLNTNQEAAVKSLLFNIGGPQFANSKARAALNAGDFDSFKKEAAEFRKVGDNVIPGLENRRAQELALFDSPVGDDPWGISRRQVSTRDNLELFDTPSRTAKEIFDERIPALRDKVDERNLSIPDELSGPEMGRGRTAQEVFNSRIPALQDMINPEADEMLQASEFEGLGSVVPPMDGVPSKGKFDTDGDGVLSKEELLAARNQMIPSKDDVKGSASTPFNLMPSGSQIVIDSPESLIARQEQILNDMVSANAPPAEIYAQQQKIDRINNIAPRQEAFSDVVKAQDKIEPINNQIEDLETQIERLEAAGLYDRANALRSEVATLNAQKPQLEADLTTATKAQDDLYRDATLPDGKIIPDVGKVTADQLEGVDTTDAEAIDDLGQVVPKPEEAPPKPSTTSTATGMQNEYDEDLDSTTQTIIDRIISDDNNLPEDNTVTGKTTPEDATKAGEEAPPEQISKAESFLSGILGDLFDKGELKRMAIMYVGGRMLGGTHSGSLNFAAKQYVNRVDKKVATKKAEDKALSKEKRLDLKVARKEFNKNLFSLNKDPNISKASIQAYKKSYDPKTGTADSSLLEQRVKPTPMNIEGNPELYYPIDGGKPVLGQKIKTGTKETGTTTMIVDQAGNPLKTYLMHQDKSRILGEPEFNKRVVEESGRYEKMMEALIKANTSTVDGEEIRPTDLKPSIISGNIAKWAIKNDVDPNDMGQIIATAYESMKAENMRDPKVRHSNITKFLDGAYIPAMVGDPQLFNVPGTNSPGDLQEISKLSSTLVAKARSSKMKGISNKSDNEVKDHIYKQFAREFKGEASYNVPDPSTGGEMTITLDEDMMKDFIEEAKKSNTSPFQLFIAQRLREPVKPK
tara:strand:- start:8716 stop:11826 length:3111 start_codon:yes stop_codon:yes gene_type:complete